MQVVLCQEEEFEYGFCVFIISCISNSMFGISDLSIDAMDVSGEQQVRKLFST